MSAEALQLLHQLLVAAQQLTAKGRERAGMTPHEYAALQHLTRHPDGLTPGQLGSLLAITSGSTTKLVDRLEARRLVRRTPHPGGDRRTNTIRPTHSATQLIHRDLKRLLSHLPPPAPTLTDDARDAIARILALANHAQTPDPPN